MKSDCWECGRSDLPIHHHHPVPKVRGGKRTIPLCELCHSKAHHRDKQMTTSKLTKEGMARAKESGKYIGRPPYGCQLDKGGKVIRGSDFHIVSKILYARFEMGWTYHKISDYISQYEKKIHFTTLYNIVRRWGNDKDLYANITKEDFNQEE